MNFQTIVSLFKELDNSDKNELIDILQKQMPKISINKDAFDISVDEKTKEIVNFCKDLANKGIDRYSYSIPCHIKNHVMEKLITHGIYRMSLSTNEINGDNVTVRLTWE